jgi:hypothetical protein
MAENPTVPTPAPTGGPAYRPASRQRMLGLGLLCTLAGLVLVAVLLPTAPGSLGTILPAAAAGLVLLWVGGILLGRGSRS